MSPSCLLPLAAVPLLGLPPSRRLSSRVAVQQYTVTHCVCNWFFQPIKMLPQLGYDSCRFIRNAHASRIVLPTLRSIWEWFPFVKRFHVSISQYGSQTGTLSIDLGLRCAPFRSKEKEKEKNVPKKPNSHEASNISYQHHPASSSCSLHAGHSVALTSSACSVEQLKLGALFKAKGHAGHHRSNYGRSSFSGKGKPNHFLESVS